MHLMLLTGRRNMINIDVSDMEWYKDYRLKFMEETDSTNAEIRRLVSAGENGDKLLLWTGYQWAGRGQTGNCWESEKGKNLLFTLCVKPCFMVPKEQFLLSEAVSLAVCKALNKITPGFTVKWPNDIYFAEKKICGILIEHVLTSSRISQSYIGVGINVNQRQFLSDAPNPVSLFQIMYQEMDLKSLLCAFLCCFDDCYAMLRHGEKETIRIAYREKLFRREGMFTFRDKDGDFIAEIADVLPDGQLVLTDQKGRVRCYMFKEVEYVL